MAPVGGVADLGETCNPERPVPVLSINGTNDVDAPFEGGPPADWLLDAVLKDGSRVRDSGWGQWLMDADESVPDTLTATAVRYGCEPEPVVEPLGEAEHYVWTCPEGAEVELVAHDGGHTWSSVTDGRTTEQLVWDFFGQHPMPE